MPSTMTRSWNRARAHGFGNWRVLHAFIQESAILLDKHTAQITRVLPADMQTAWQILADPLKLASCHSC